jgi:8-oxo-dGTP pyrophosphatase MutT (NUDIX family)
MSTAQFSMDDHLRGRILANFANFERHSKDAEDLIRAAVTLLLIGDNRGEACFVITRRASGLRDHPGQWALPGGRANPGESAIEAALRETREEIGLELDTNTVIGLLDDYPTRSGFLITPVVVWGVFEPDLIADPNEVAEIYCIPLADLEKPDVPRLRTIPESDRPVISIPIETLGANIHAPTAAILYQLREVAVRGKSTRVAHFEEPVFAWK